MRLGTYTRQSLVQLTAMLSLCLVVIGCNTSKEAAEQGTEVAQSCVEADLVAQCPPNTVPDLQSDANATCSMSGSIDASQDVDELSGSASIDTACVGEGSCRMVCRLETPCAYGVERISPSEGIFCAAPPAGCGNGLCDQGESPESCPIDCGMTCEPSSVRCVGNALQTCSIQGIWEDPIDCPEGNLCEADLEMEASCKAPRCGDGVVQGSEACDDGNDIDDDACRNDCSLPRCGDGIVQSGEVCDDGNSNDMDQCNNQCQASSCGDGIVQVGEECDDANNINTDACLNDCSINRCGDGIVFEGTEECDDANTINEDSCTNQCLTARCGDSFVQSGVEECDDGNQENTDDCTSQCTLARCGDSIVQLDEECDDGNQEDNDACLSTCESARCGDALFYSVEEDCDDGNQEDNDACLSTCESASCGDGIRRVDLNIGEEGFEYCDDGDDNEYNGCNSQCLQTEVEPNNTTTEANFEEANVILFNSIQGVLESRISEILAGKDNFAFEFDCGVGMGTCPADNRPTYLFTLSSTTRICQRMGVTGCIDRGFNVATVCNDACYGSQPELMWNRLGTTVTWEVTADIGGLWVMELQNSSTNAYNYTLSVVQLRQ